jgi:hypothetical protein
MEVTMPEGLRWRVTTGLAQFESAGTAFTLALAARDRKTVTEAGAGEALARVALDREPSRTGSVANERGVNLSGMEMEG